MHSESIDHVQKVLREPFRKEQIGSLPRITCPQCRESRNRVCDRHTKAQCGICQQWITAAHMHLSYVGHAAVTDRLLKADPGWTWEPAYRDVDPQVLAAACASGDADIVAQVIANSPPLMDQNGLWMKLTVGGVTRLGYGTDDNPGMDHNKVLIGDAIRNAGMRFGVGLDLWSKEDLGAEETPTITGAPVQPAGASQRDWAQEARNCADLDSLLLIGKECAEAGAFVDATRTTLLRRRRELETAGVPLNTNGH